MVTEFGKILRKERIDRGWTLNDMSKHLKISAAYLSHMEMGRRPVPEEVLGHLNSLLGYHELKAAKLKKAAQEGYRPDVIKIDGKNMNEHDQEIALMFARRFSDLNVTDKKKLFEILQGDE